MPEKEYFIDRVKRITDKYEALITRKNRPINDDNGVYTRYEYPVITAEHAPLIWRYDFNYETNPFFMERLGVNAAFNSGAIELDGKFYLVVRVEGNDRKSFFAVAESDNGIDNFRFWDYPPIPVPRKPTFMICALRSMRTAGFTVCSAPKARIPPPPTFLRR